MRENITCPDQGWQQMPTERLDRVLQAELEKEHPNEEVVLPILREFEEREKDFQVENTQDASDILRKLSEHSTLSKRVIHKRKWFAGVAATVAVVCLVAMFASPTAQAESLLDVLFRWTSSIFEFFSPEEDASNPAVEVVFETDNLGLRQLYNKVTERGVTAPVVPMWLPEGLVLSELKDSPIPGGVKVFGKFENDGNLVLITYRISTDISVKVEKKEVGVELFDSGGIDHFIVENNESLSVTWMVDGVECVMNADVSKEDTYKIIKSIYRSELTQ